MWHYSTNLHKKWYEKQTDLPSLHPADFSTSKQQPEDITYKPLTA